MFKRKVKLKIHNKICDIRQSEYGNMIDLHSSKNHDLMTTFMSDNKTVLVDFGISMTLPKYYGAKIYPRSSTFKKYGAILTNGTGIIEANYAGRWMGFFHMLTMGIKPRIKKGDRLAQFEIYLLPKAPLHIKLLDLFISGFKFIQVEKLITTRGGFGSSD